jgi:predicted alpha/beta-hydrolase family hydrolase
MIAIETPHGPAHAHVSEADDPVAALLLGHGAGGGFSSKDLIVTREVALEQRVTTVFVQQPYSVAGRRSPAPPPQLDAAWLAVVEGLDLGGLPLIAGGRSSGARVACRTAAATQAIAVLCLAFPVHPPGKPEKTRLAELDAVTVPVLVVQGARDPFGMPPEAEGREVVTVPGTHSLASGAEQVGAAVRDWLPRVLS